MLRAVLSSFVLYAPIFYLGHVSPSHERMQVGLEELQDLKGVWQELAKIWEQIDELKEKPWLSVAPRKVSEESFMKKKCIGFVEMQKTECLQE